MTSWQVKQLSKGWQKELAALKVGRKSLQVKFAAAFGRNPSGKTVNYQFHAAEDTLQLVSFCA